MLRSIQKAYELIKAEDSETAITPHTIRMWCKDGKIKYVAAGNRMLIDMDSLKELINNK